METIKLQLNIDEANTILKALGELPYIQVAQLIQKIRQQASEQLSEMQPVHGGKERKKNEDINKNSSEHLSPRTA